MLTSFSLWAGGSVAKHELGREIYNFRCYYCHGYSGDAKTLAASMMAPQPVNFTITPPEKLSRDRMIAAVTHGTNNSAMKSFTYYLSEADIELVVDFIRYEFMTNQNINTLYHTIENGWPDHLEKYAIAVPFATGAIKLDTPLATMGEAQRAGYRLYMTTCISCHDRSHVEDEGLVWRARSISFPRNNFSFTDFESRDGATGASVYLKHEVTIDPELLNANEKAGQKLFSQNCAFCHGEDGSGKNWIGAFLDDAPRDLTDPEFIAISSKESLRVMIGLGKRDTSMPAWKYVLAEEKIDLIIEFLFTNAKIRNQ